MDVRQPVAVTVCIVCPVCGKITTTKILLETWTAKVSNEETVSGLHLHTPPSFSSFLSYFRFVLSLSLFPSFSPPFFRFLNQLLPFLAFSIIRFILSFSRLMLIFHLHLQVFPTSSTPLLIFPYVCNNRSSSSSSAPPSTHSSTPPSAQEHCLRMLQA